MKRDRIFGSTGFCCVLDSNMSVIWCNNRQLFRKLLASKELTVAFTKACEEHSIFEHYSTYESVKYRTVFIPVPDKRYVAVAYPEDRYVKSVYSQMYRRIFNVIGNSNRCMSALLESKDMLSECDVPENIHSLIDDALGYTETVLSESAAISELFDCDHNCEYVNIVRRLDSTFQVIRKYERIHDRRIGFVIGLKHTVARINYLILECVLFETARLIYKCLPRGGNTVMKIGETENGSLSFVADILLSEGADRSFADAEIRNILCAVELIGGKASFTFGEHTLAFSAEIFAALSDNTGKLLRQTEQEGEQRTGYESLLPREYDNAELMFCDECEPYAADLSSVLAELILA
ncbi:MAG: hypothetical protein IK093_09655 [Ruminiclostridium sp.]|nr:hypothetical protein [Ruminiclostridium sp.]